MRIPQQPDPILLRGLSQRRHSRRGFLRLAGLGATGLALSACGVSGQRQDATDVDDYWAAKEETGHVRFANWPLYMDPDLTELRQFTEATGITVDYKEDVHEPAAFFGRIQPQLANGSSTGYDLMVLPNGLELARLIGLGYLAPLDHDRMPNFAAHAADHYRSAAYDVGNQFTVPYASGITGIAYNPDFVDREITSIADLWDPEFRGRVGMMSDVQEISSFGMLMNGTNPEESDEADWEAAAAVLREQRDAGIVRAYYGQDYVQPLTNGDVWLTMAWSGDVYQQNVEEGTNLKFVVPTEGATLWTDNMMIPITSDAPVDAIALMDFFYDPEIAAGLAAYINFIPPVPETQDVLAAWAAETDDEEEAEELTELVESPLVFPTEQDYANLYSFASPEPGDQEQGFIDLFNAITQA